MLEEEKQTFADSVLAEWKKIEEERAKLVAQLQTQEQEKESMAAEIDAGKATDSDTDVAASNSRSMREVEEQRDELEKRVGALEKVGEAVAASTMPRPIDSNWRFLLRI